jgi:hypothetical protein
LPGARTCRPSDPIILLNLFGATELASLEKEGAPTDGHLSASSTPAFQS